MHKGDCYCPECAGDLMAEVRRLREALEKIHEIIWEADDDDRLTDVIRVVAAALNRTEKP